MPLYAGLSMQSIFEDKHGNFSQTHIISTEACIILFTDFPMFKYIFIFIQTKKQKTKKKKKKKQYDTSPYGHRSQLLPY